MKQGVFFFIQNFSKQTTVHGLHIVGFQRLHILERLLWIILITIAGLGAIAIGYSNWIRYVANPSVVSLQKDFRNWENSLPAMTGCFVNKVDKKKADEYILNKWHVNSTDAWYNYYLGFVETVANISFNNLAQFKNYVNDTNLQNVDMLELTTQVHPPLSGTLVTFDARHKTFWMLIMSELGLCFSVNTKFVHLFGITSNKINNFTSETSQRVLRCHYLNGLCYARYDSDPQLPLKYYVHSFLDIVHATIDAPLLIRESEELEINYRMQETQSSPALRYLSPFQRRCRFDDEPLTSDMDVFSSSICYMICRYKLIMKLCGCRPFFYHTLGGELCNISGLVCVSKYAVNITKSPSQLGCNCPQPCDIITYLPQVPKYTKWEYGYFDQRITFRWGLLPPTTKFHRDVLFGFEDLVVSFGGTLALFLGISFISAIEIVFLIIENLLIYYKYHSRDDKIKYVAPAFQRNPLRLANMDNFRN